MVNGKKKNGNFFDKLKSKQGVEYFSKNPLEILYFLLLILGLIISFFSLYTGAFIVGLAVGLTFWAELSQYFGNIKDYYSTFGIFKTIIFAGFLLFLLIALPTLVLGAAVGYGIISIIRFISKNRNH